MTERSAGASDPTIHTTESISPLSCDELAHATGGWFGRPDKTHVEPAPRYDLMDKVLMFW